MTDDFMIKEAANIIQNSSNCNPDNTATWTDCDCDCGTIWCELDRMFENDRYKIAKYEGEIDYPTGSSFKWTDPESGSEYLTVNYNSEDEKVYEILGVNIENESKIHFNTSLMHLEHDSFYSGCGTFSETDSSEIAAESDFSLSTKSTSESEGYWSLNSSDSGLIIQTLPDSPNMAEKSDKPTNAVLAAKCQLITDEFQENDNNVTAKENIQEVISGWGTTVSQRLALSLSAKSYEMEKMQGRKILFDITNSLSAGNFRHENGYLH